MDPLQIYVTEPDLTIDTVPKEKFVEERVVSSDNVIQLAKPKVLETCGEFSVKKLLKNVKADKVSPALNNKEGLPKVTSLFLAKYELLLSETEFEKLESLFAAKIFNVENSLYQTWLVLKLASLLIPLIPNS